MMGIFRRIGATEKCDIRIVSSEDTLCHLLEMANSSERPDGIISGIPYSERARNAIVASGLPFVGIGMSENDMPMFAGNSGFVMNDNEGIGRAAAQHFLCLGGFRSFAYVPDVLSRSWSKLRGDAFAAALNKAGKNCETFNSDSGGTTALSRFLSGLPRPAAVLAAWDGRAADVIRAAHLARLNIPGDIAILGVDDDDLICEHTIPPLSSVKTDAEGMGEAAAQIMLDMLGKRRKYGSKCVRCPIIGITERHTTKPPAPAAFMINRALAFIKAEATNGIRPSDVAKFLKVSRRLLDLRFRQFESKSVAKTIAQERLTAAMRLLAETDFPVKSIFRQSGFGNISHATKFFKRATGVSPEAWRTLHSRA